MKMRLLALLAFVTAASVGLCAENAAKPAKPALEKGMDAATIRELYGKPDEIQSLKGDTKAEKWIYRRKAGQTVYQTANTQAFIPALVGFDSGGVQIGKAVVPEYRLKYARAYQVTALLIVDGKLELGRQWYEQTEEFAD